MARDHRFTITLQPEPEGGFTVLVPALPEVVTFGETRDEALEMARDAITLVLDVYRESGRPVPDDVETRVEHLTIAA